MKKIIASLAFVVCLIAPVLAVAQQQREANPARRTTNSARAGTQKLRNTPSQRPVTTASHVEQYVEGDVILEGEPYYGGEEVGCSSCGGGGCDSCGISDSSCGSCNAPRGFCICFPAHGWVQAEYLLWYGNGMRVPSLVTTSPVGTARASAGVIGQTGTSVLYGGNDLLTNDQSGFRIRFGWWLSAFPGLGIEGEYVGLGETTESYFRQSTGSPILARPFFNARDGAEDAELIAFPGVVSGSIAVDTTTRLDGAAFRFRRQLCSSSGCGFSEWCCQTVPTSSRLDGTFGYRFWELKESLQIREKLQMQSSTEPGSFDITDRFATRNLFNGAELGVLWQGRRGWWSLDALMRLGIGNNNQTVTVSGSSTIVDNGVSTTYPNSGYLAQRTNIGTYDRNKFTMVPELGLTLGYQMTRRLRMTGGYSLIYMGNVVRPGDQIDLNLNPNLLPPELVPFTGPLRPQFQFTETDYWVQGLSFGGEFRW